jgi:hypothetical protein
MEPDPLCAPSTLQAQHGTVPWVSLGRLGVVFSSQLVLGSGLKKIMSLIGSRVFSSVTLRITKASALLRYGARGGINLQARVDSQVWLSQDPGLGTASLYSLNPMRESESTDPTATDTPCGAARGLAV